MSHQHITMKLASSRDDSERSDKRIPKSLVIHIVCAQKKNGALILCIDYRKLNERTKRDAYARPQLLDTLDMLTNAKVFLTIDFNLSKGTLKWRNHLPPCYREAAVMMRGSSGISFYTGQTKPKT